MKTWEMIKELTENPNKEFIRISDNKMFKTSNKIENGHISGYYVTQLTLSAECILLKDEWEIVPQEVTWQEAIQAWVDGKTVICKLTAGDSPSGMAMRFVFDEGSDESRYPLDKIEITKGKWYIE